MIQKNAVNTLRINPFKGTRGRLSNSILGHERPLALSVGPLGGPRHDRNQEKAILESAHFKILKYGKFSYNVYIYVYIFLLTFLFLNLFEQTRAP